MYGKINENSLSVPLKMKNLKKNISLFNWRNLMKYIKNAILLDEEYFIESSKAGIKI